MAILPADAAISSTRTQLWAVAIGFRLDLAGGEGSRLQHAVSAPLMERWNAAARTVITGWDYLRVGLKHMD